MQNNFVVIFLQRMKWAFSSLFLHCKTHHCSRSLVFQKRKTESGVTDCFVEEKVWQILLAGYGCKLCSRFAKPCTLGSQVVAA